MRQHFEPGLVQVHDQPAGAGDHLLALQLREDLRHADARQPADAAHLLLRERDRDHPPEPVFGDQLDLGEILAEELSLALDPYPRAPDADQRLAEFSGDGNDAAGPFEALARLRRH